jgi:acetyl-CoA carboxylase biotin carboxylase subunit
MIAKLIVHGGSRDAALARARTALAGFTIEGIQTNLPFLAEVLDDSRFCSGAYDTSLVSRMRG